MSACTAFPDSWSAYARAVLGRIDVELLDRDILDLECSLGRRAAGAQVAAVLGVSADLAPLLAIVVYSTSRSARERAGALVLDSLRGAA